MGSRDPIPEGLLTPVSFQILLALAENDLHGYGIKLEIEQRTAGTMRLGSGTLYEAIQRLERAGYVAAAKAPPDAPAGARKRRYYKIQTPGRKALEDELVRMEQTVRYAKRRRLLPQAR